MEKNREDGIRKYTISTVIVMSCTTVSRILGFIRTAIIATIFGASGKADIINLTFSIPNNLRKLLAEGALSNAFIPVFSASIIQSSNNFESKKIVRNIISFQLIILIPFCILTIIFANPLIRIFLTEFKDPDKLKLSVNLFRWFINYLLFISISAAVMGVLNSHNKFFIPAITPILFSISVIFSILLLNNRFGVYSMAIGVLIGGIAQIFFKYPLFHRLGYDFHPDLSFKNEQFRRIMKQWLPVAATSSIFTITQMIAFRFATGLENGSTSALTNALVFWQLPYGIFSASITTVLFPQMSKQAALNNRKGLQKSVQYGISFLFILLIPSAVVLLFFGKEIIAVALQRGKFTAENTYMTYRVLIYYSLGLFSVGAYNFLQRFFYSVRNYKTPFNIAFIVCLSDILLSLWLKETKLGVTGLAAANSIAFTFGFFLMLIYARKELDTISGINILKTVFKVTLSIIPVSVFLILYLKYTGEWWINGSTLYNFMLLLPGGIIPVLLTLGMYKTLKIDILNVILKRKRK